MELHVGLGRGVILSNHFEGLRALLLDGEIFLRWQFYLALDEDLADKNLADEFVTIELVLSCIRSRYYVLELVFILPSLSFLHLSLKRWSASRVTVLLQIIMSNKF